MVKENSTKPLLEVVNLVKDFPLAGTKKVVHAVRDVSIAVARGETLALVGESGSGKSTTGLCIMRLLPITSGIIRFDGQDIATASESKLRAFRRRSQMVLQEPYEALNPRLRIDRLIAEPLGLIPEMSKDEKRRRRVLEVLEQVRLPPETAKAYPGQLTSGEQKRVSIARALATDPDFIVFDEPTTALDIRVRGQIIALISNLQRQFGLAALFITHDLNSVRHVARYVAVMSQGSIVEVGLTEDIFANPVHNYTKTLLDAELPIPRAR
jgi:ABC-type glutathione transport system ATPase component